LEILISAIGLLATAFSVSSVLPQIIKALRIRKTDDVSIRFILVLITGLTLWVIYGIGRNDAILIIGNSIAVALNSFMLILKVKYSKDPLSEEQ
jgi:MtN3 and saliva related transmembrane protein